MTSAMYGPAMTTARRERAGLQARLRGLNAALGALGGRRIYKRSDVIEGRPGEYKLSKDGRTAYQCQEDGSWRKLPPEAALTLIEERRAHDAIVAERERILREKNERSAAKQIPQQQGAEEGGAGPGDQGPSSAAALLPEEPMDVNPRDVTVAYPMRQEGQPARVRLTHRPSGRTFEGQGHDYAAAKEDARWQLDAWAASPEATA